MTFDQRGESVLPLQELHVPDATPVKRHRRRSRRYQGWGTEAEEHAGKRMALYQVMEKYDAISRSM